MNNHSDRNAVNTASTMPLRNVDTITMTTVYVGLVSLIYSHYPQLSLHHYVLQKPQPDILLLFHS